MNSAQIVLGHWSKMLQTVALIMAIWCGVTQAETGTEFPGTVLMVDHATGKFAVKKDPGGTRFTFVANDKTQFLGTGFSSLKDLRKDERVIVLYQVQGSQYVALSVSKQK
jgi:hypothetical protein